MLKGKKTSKRRGANQKSKKERGAKGQEVSDAAKVNYYEEDLHKDALVWYREEGADDWKQYAFVSKSGADDCRLRDSGGGELTVPRSFVHTCNPSFLEGTSDLTNLTYLNEPSVLHNVRLRYERDEIYTRAGNVLVAVNPFKQLPIYTEEVARAYESGPSDQGPHIFEIAQRSYGELFETGKSQSVVISGESGSGKTENTKFVLRQLTQKSKRSTGKGVDKAILQTNPILEAFGNAKTLRNNNSSRFGKLINIYFDSPSQISGGNIYTYLLEKSRVVSVQKEERSYHVFYQLCKGCSEEDRRKYRLGRAEDYAYLNQSECFHISGTDDGKEFEDLKAAFQTFGLGVGMQDRIFKLLSGILHLGNVQFFEEETEGGQEARIAGPEPLAAAAELFGVDKSSLEKVLTGRVIRVGKEQMVKAMDVNQALNARDALAKHVYSALFEWLVKSMNAFIGKKKVEGRSYRDINLLDIYGFECFKVNSFEQLCINYANERLQQLFNRHLIELEQREYKKENLVWEHIPYSGNDHCLELLEGKKSGFIGIIADEINIPQASDSTLALKLKDQLACHSCFHNNAREPLRFSIAHYPGLVEYDVSQFLEKNKDTLSPDLVNLVSSNKDSLLWTLTQSSDRVRDLHVQNKSGRRQSTSVRQLSVAATFKGQLTSLIESLSETNVHYVRCIKPNSKQVSANFNSDLVLHQLKCCGVFEVVQMARSGYPTKFSYEDFSERYNFLVGSGGGAVGSTMDCKEVCKVILKQFNIDPSQYQFGSTRLFLRAGALGKVEELQKLYLRCTVTIQAWFRALVCRRKFIEFRSNVIRTQACARGYVARRAFKVLLRENRAASRIQANVRAHLGRKKHCRMVELRRLEIERKDREMELEKMQSLERTTREKVVNEVVTTQGRETRPLQAQEKMVDHPPAISESQTVLEMQAEVNRLREENRSLQAALPSPESQAVLEMQAEVNRLREENRNLQAALQQERELKLDFSEQLIVTEASYAQEFKAMKQTISTIREYLTESAGESMLQKCMQMQDMIDDELQNNNDLSTRQQAHVDKVSREFNRNASVFDDDADFIEEVVAGHTEVENMDCVYELKNLKLRFEDWKDRYKKKLAYLNRCLAKNADPKPEKLNGDTKKKGISKILGFKRRA
ncbi:heavy chain of myosin [Chloropicon primus]|uniref:Heavy chain of myosin n=1 Tax=Chloropicon primus TaxID=1764295 RepID=A0A5B8MC41_9CHLO|nr:heavy chain of myosin [Chloropicon primus]|eukprot:QDZ18026.1 heavy chain of myosin [Chloropicon primus]